MKRIPKDIRQCKYCSNCCTVVLKNWDNKHSFDYCYLGIDSAIDMPYPKGAKDCPDFNIANKYKHTDLSDACNKINELRRIKKIYINK